MTQFRNTKTRIFFILQLGYCKAKQQVFNFSLDDVCHDVQFISNTFYYDSHSSSISFTWRISRDYVRLQRQVILSLFDYDFWTSDLAPEIQPHMSHLLRYYPKGHSAFRQLLVYFDHRKILLPSYTTLQDIFSRAFADEDKRLKGIIDSVPELIGNQLTALIAQEEGITALNKVRADQKDFQYTAVRTEVSKALRLEALYTFTNTFIPSLHLSKNAVRYYAEMTEQYGAYRLRRLNKHQQGLYTLCFVHHRYQQIMDNLIVSFSYHVRSVMDAGKTYASMAHMEHSSGIVTHFPKLVKFLKWFPNRNPDLTSEELNEIAYGFLPKAQFTARVTFLEGKSFDKKAALWEFYGKSFRVFSLYLRPVFITVAFEYYKADSYVGELINILKSHYTRGKRPSDFKICDDLGCGEDLPT